MYIKIISIILTFFSTLLLSERVYTTYTDDLSSYMLSASPIPYQDTINITPKYEINDETSSSLNLYAKAACLMDADSGRILYSSNSDETRAMASTTKIMTCILALECAKPDTIVTVSSRAASMPDVQLNICSGEKYYLKDLLYSLMLESHNDTAVAIAESIGDSVEGFASLMNDKATSLNLRNTHFVTPNGLDADGHYTTAADLCRLTAYAIKNKKFLEIISTPSYSFSEIDGKRKCNVYNRDSFLTMYKGAIGVKTGFTGDAGYCFAGAAKRNDITLVSSVLASGWPPNKSYKWTDTKSLMNYGFDNYKMHELLSGTYSSASENAFLTPVCIQDNLKRTYGYKKCIQIAFEASKKMLLKNGDTVYLKFDIPSYISIPIKKNEKIGTATLFINDEPADLYPIVSCETVNTITYDGLITKLFNTYTLKR